MPDVEEGENQRAQLSAGVSIYRRKAVGQEGGVAYPQNLFQPFLVLHEGQPQGIVQAGQKKIGLEERELKPSVVAWNKRRFLKKGGREEL